MGADLGGGGRRGISRSAISVEGISRSGSARRRREFCRLRWSQIVLFVDDILGCPEAVTALEPRHQECLFPGGGIRSRGVPPCSVRVESQGRSSDLETAGVRLWS